MSGLGNDFLGELLLLRPELYGSRRNQFVGVAKDHHGVGRHWIELVHGDRRCDQDQALGVELLAQPVLHEGAERETRQRPGQAGVAGFDEAGDRQQIIGFANAGIECAIAHADATKVGTHADPAGLVGGLGERGHDLVVEAAAVQRMRMRDQQQATALGFRVVDHGFQLACGHRNAQFVAFHSGGLHFSCRRSTVRPCLR